MRLTPDQIAAKRERARVIRAAVEAGDRRGAPPRGAPRSDPPRAGAGWSRIGSECEVDRGLAARAASLLRVLGSRRVPEHVYRERMAACASCDHVSINSSGAHFCRCCGCPVWFLSSLERKNWKAGHACLRSPPAFGSWIEGDGDGELPSGL